MKRVIYYMTFALFLTSFYSASLGQNLKDDIVKLGDAMSAANKFAIVFEVGIFKNSTDKNAYVKKYGKLFKDGEKYFSVFDNVSILTNDKVFVYVDEPGENIYFKPFQDIKKIPKSGKQNALLYAPNQLVASIDSSLKKCSEIQYGGLRGGSKVYFIKCPLQLINVTEIYLDSKTGLISKIVYYYNREVMKENNKVEIVYKQFSVTPSFLADDFSEEKFLKLTGSGDYKPIDKYKHFDVISDVPERAYK